MTEGKAIETTYERYQRVLGQIADGADNPKELATEALRSRKPNPTYSWKTYAEKRARNAEAKRRLRIEQAKAAYLNWLKVGHPPIAPYARAYGVHPSTMRRLLEKGERRSGLPYGQRRLVWGARDRNYNTVDERGNP